ncbi:hypothetical protein T552_03358 [Pneumocystis carinii B80]|uniref:WW domain-containing protein n=1 Tax=Pneumocystis carinii (strain B80) TaxID=1408658 RepID=A0A0W4ZBV4_PNEC8|nr:hypothetical protein T552_03358 [Pneumocystis carinii B80]KTW25745.1 hypothetical protein T552_03358 [Pneumocystis carinii B80]
MTESIIPDYEKTGSSEPLPPGWTQHLAPSGHLYYYHKETRVSTYKRPIHDSEGSKLNNTVLLEETKVLEKSGEKSGLLEKNRSYPIGRERSRYGKTDRPKYKYPIAKAFPWVRVITKRRCQFVHNPETGVSLWVPPEEVYAAMIEEKKNGKDFSENLEGSEELSSESEESLNSFDTKDSSDVYHDEENEIREEDSCNEPSTGLDHTEYTENDIAWQLEGMENNGMIYIENEMEMMEEEKALQFKTMLQELDVNPYHPWDQEVSKISMDPRYFLINTMKGRKDLFEEFCRERIAQQKKEIELRPKRDPKISFITLLQIPQTSKMYWHEFRRKFKKEQEYKDFGMNDKEREKLFRAYQEQMKYDSKRKEKDFYALLKETSTVTKNTTLLSLPDEVLCDLRYAVIPSEKLEEYIEKYTQSL